MNGLAQQHCSLHLLAHEDFAALTLLPVPVSAQFLALSYFQHLLLLLF
jgi:hypothetical protein